MIPTASPLTNAKSIIKTSGFSERKVFSAINLLLASPTTLTPCSRSAALIVANSNASSLAIITRGNAVAVMIQGIAISIVKREVLIT
jgi:hypothetical protein